MADAKPQPRGLKALGICAGSIFGTVLALHLISVSASPELPAVFHWMGLILAAIILLTIVSVTVSTQAVERP